MDLTTEEVRRAHREDFYGALRKNDFEKLVCKSIPTTTCL